jgi:hypothetical protein
MTKFAIRLAGEDSSRVFETEEDETLNGLAKQFVEVGYVLGKMKTSERLPEPQDTVILASQVRWLALSATTETTRRF